MALSDVRDLFIKASGRRDLGTIGGADNGANFFINSGARFLDGMVGATQKTFAWYKKDFPTNTGVLFLPYCAALQQVWISTTTTQPVQLARASSEDVKDGFSRFKRFEDDSITASGSPQCWAPTPIGLEPSQATLDDTQTEFTSDTEAVAYGDHFGTLGILVYPRTDKLYTFSVLGRFLSMKLVDDADINFWTEAYPDILVQAACYKLEGFYRNTQGQADWLAGIKLDLGNLAMDATEEEIAGLNQIGG